MSDSEPLPRTPPRMRALMAIPLVFAAVALVGALIVFRHLSVDRPASGARVVLTFAGACVPEARDVIYQRVDLIGLGQPDLATQDGALVLTATLPGLPDDDTAIPALLTRRGALRITAKDEALATELDVASATVNLDTSGAPYASVKLIPSAAARITEALRAGEALDVTLDGALIVHQEGGDLEGDQLSLSPTEGDPRARMRQAADWAILLSSGALPCDLTVTSVAAPALPG